MKWQVRELWPGLAGKNRQTDTDRKDLVMSSRTLREDIHFMHINNGVLTVRRRFVRVSLVRGEMVDNVFSNSSFGNNQ